MASLALAAGVGIGGAWSWVSQLYAYNREAYLNDIQLQQRSVHQKDNTFIMMSNMDREEVRDLTAASVSNISYVILISTVILAIAGEMFFQGQIPEDSAAFVLNAYMLCLGTSVLHLCLAILSGLTAVVRAQQSATGVLTTMRRPRWKSKFDEMAYVKTSTAFEDQALLDILSPPLWDRFFAEDGTADNAAMDSEAYSNASPQASSPASSSSPRQDRDGRTSGDRARPRPSAWAASDLFRRETDYAAVPTEEPEPLASASSPEGREKSRSNLPTFAWCENWRKERALWGRFATFMFKCAALGTTSLLEACHYLQVGMLYSEYTDDAWAFWAVNIIFTSLEFMMFWFLIAKCNEYSRDKPPRVTRLGRFIEWAMGFKWTMALFLTAGPLLGAFCAVTDSPQVDDIFVPLCYLVHSMASFTFFLLFWDDGDVKLPGKKERADAKERSGAKEPLLDAKRWRVTYKLMRRTMCMISILWFGGFLWAIGLATGLQPALFGQVHYVNSEAIHLFRQIPPELDLKVVDVVLPDDYFRPHALVCPRQQVFMADMHRVYELDRKANHVRQYGGCRGLNASIADLAARCNASRCWPLALLNTDSAPAVLDCATGLLEPLFQAKFPALRFAKMAHSSSPEEAVPADLVVAHPASLTQYFWSAERQGWEPRWDIETWSPAETMRKSVRALDRYRHGEADEDRLLVFRSSRELASLDLKTGKTCGRWSIPEMEEIVGGGCGTWSGSSVLVFAAKWTSDASLYTADLPPKGFDVADVCEEASRA